MNHLQKEKKKKKIQIVTQMLLKIIKYNKVDGLIEIFSDQFMDF